MNARLLSRTASFGFVGGIATVLFFLFSWIFVRLAPQLPGFVSVTLAYALCGAVSYFGHKHITFRSEQSLRSELPRFILTFVIGIVASSSIAFVLNDLMGLPVMVAAAVIVISIPILTYVMLSGFVFSASLSKPAASRPAFTSGFFFNDAAVLATMAVFIAASVLHFFFTALHADISWLLIVADRMIGGDALYSDVYEINPPLAVYMYWPAVWLSHVTHWPAEHFVTFAALASFPLSLAIAAAVLHQTHWLNGAVRSGDMFPLAVLIFLPTAVFAQREFFGVVLFLPYLVLVAARVQGGWNLPVPRTVQIVAGICGAFIVCLKPHYALAALFPVLLAVFRQRNWRLLFTVENISLAAIVLFYGSLVLLAFPDYVNNVVPLALSLYVANPAMLVQAAVAGLLVFGFAMVANLVLMRRQVFDPAATSALAAALGFAIALVAQGKGWDYHVYPATVFAGTALAITFRKAPPATLGLGAGRILALASVVSFAMWSAKSVVSGTQYTSELAALDSLPPDASLSVFTQHFKLVHPAARHMHARWIGREGSDWVAGLALKWLETTPQNHPRYAEVHEILNEAIDRKATEIASGPDLLAIVPMDEVTPVFMDDPRIAKAMRNYEPLFALEPVHFYARKGFIAGLRPAVSPVAMSD